MDVLYPTRCRICCMYSSVWFCSKVRWTLLCKNHGQLDTTPQVAQNTTRCVHTKVLVRLLLLKNCLDDCIKYGDGDRLCTALKFMWPIFKPHNKWVCYAVYGLDQILSITATSHWTEIRQFVNLKRKKPVIIQPICLLNTATKNPKPNSLYIEEKPPRKHRIIYLRIKRKSKNF